MCLLYAHSHVHMFLYVDANDGVMKASTRRTRLESEKLNLGEAQGLGGPLNIPYAPNPF